jgi:hypothetical protein
MDITQNLSISNIEELKILSDVRLIERRDLNQIYSKENLQVQFKIQGDLQGLINCHLCLDGFELSTSERNYIFPLFVETMNILIGKQLSESRSLSQFKLTISPPKLSMVARELNTNFKLGMQAYDLDVEGLNFCVLTEYILKALN